MSHSTAMSRPRPRALASCDNNEGEITPTPSADSRRVNRILREGLLSVTGHPVEAMILQKFLFWTGRLWDFDQFMYEECMHRKPDIQGESPESGWVEKTVADLLSDLALPSNRHSIKRHLKSLVQKGFLYEREDPVYPWKHTRQYRLNLFKLQTALSRRGYSMDERFFA